MVCCRERKTETETQTFNNQREMKKILLVLILTAGMAITANAQDYKTALGLRAGVPYGITVKHFVNPNNAFEGILASRWDGVAATVLYENVHWTGQFPALNWYWGFGGHLGFWDSHPTYTGPSSTAVIGLDAVLGLEYTFDEVPFNLALDILPSFNVIGHSGWNGVHGALSIRYVF